jgi:hypothetical protein
MPSSPMSMQDGIRAVQQAFMHSDPAPRWPMYVRQAKQYLRTAIEGFDERKYGFASVVDLLRAAGKEGVLRLERDRQGAVRVFPGSKLPERAAVQQQVPKIYDVEDDEVVDEANGNVIDASAAEAVHAEDASGDADAVGINVEAVADAPIVDGETIEPGDEQPVEDTRGTPAKKGARKRKAAAPRATKTKAAKTARPRSRKSPSR